MQANTPLEGAPEQAHIHPRFGLPQQHESDSDNSDIEVPFDNQLKVLEKGQMVLNIDGWKAGEGSSSWPGEGYIMIPDTILPSKRKQAGYFAAISEKSERSQFREKARITKEKKANLPTQTLLSFAPRNAFTPQGESLLITPNIVEESEALAGQLHTEEEYDSVVNGVVTIDSLVERISISDVNKQVSSTLQDRTLHATDIRDLTLLQQYTCQLLKPVGKRLAKVVASLAIAKVNHDKSDGIALARRIRSSLIHYQTYGALASENRGGKRAGSSFLDDEHVFIACREYLMAQPIGTISVSGFTHALNEDILPRLIVTTGVAITERTVRRWLDRLGFDLSKEQKGIYIDGHEREDVINYRDKIFLPQMEYYDRFTTQYYEIQDGPNKGELLAIPPNLAPGEKRHIYFFHDESCFHAMEFKKGMWLHTTQQKVPRKGGQGKLIHVSDFIGPEGRIYEITDSGVNEARKIIYPGANGDPWWDTDQLRVQLQNAIQIFERIHPDCVAIFVFDQSSAHQSHGDGALNAFEMNLRPGGKVTPQNDTYYPPESTNGMEGQLHHLYTEEKPGEKIAKGIKVILEERGCLPEGKIRAKCLTRCPDPEVYPPPLTDKPPCCLARVLQNHKDFREQKPVIAELIEKAGHVCLFIPKFHCELNPIEMVWGYSKACFRKVIKNSFQHAKREVVIALDACSIDTMRRFCNRSFRFMDAYRKGLGVKAAAWCVRKQKGHRSISKTVMEQFDAQNK